MEMNTLSVLLLTLLCAAYARSYVVIHADEPTGRPLLGTREKICTWGPSYWCTNITTAKGCGAVKHCIQTVWEHEVVPEDNDDICKICKDMVQQARDQLQSNQTQEDLKEVFEGSCNLIPLKPVAKSCDKLVDDFVPELVETLSSQMNPQVVCTVAGLCNNAEIDRMLASAGKLTHVSIPKSESLVNSFNSEKDLSDCEGCTHVLSRMEMKFKTIDRDAMLINILEICGRLGSLSDACSSIVITHFNELYSSVGKKLLASDTCEVAQMCSKNHKKGHVNVEIVNESSVGVVPVKDDLTCQFCERMVLHLRDILVANTTESEFQLVLQGLCKQMGKVQDECLGFVSEYYGMVYNFLVNNLNGKEICSLAGICPQPGKTNGKSPIWPLLPAHLSVEDSIENDNRGNLGKPVVHIAVSSDSVSAQVSDPALMQLPIDQMTPHMLINFGSNKEVCEFCEYFLHYVQTQLADTKTEEKVEAIVKQACNHFPKSIISQCHDFVDQYGNAFIALIDQEIDPSVVCPGLGFCPSQSDSEMVMVGGIDQYDDKPGCPLCLLAIQQVDSLIKDNKTEENIKSALESLCAHLPKSLTGECDSFVDTYSEQLVDMLIADFTPQEVCVYIKLCNASKSVGNSALDVGDTLTNEVPQYENEKLVKVKGDQQCVICEFIMTRLESFLKDNATEEEIKAAVHGICNHLPKTVSPQCNKFVDQYSDLLVTILAQTLDPKGVCTALKLCSSDGMKSDLVALSLLQQHSRKHIEECALCEGIVQALDTYLQDPTVENKVDELLKRACQILPSKLHGKCSNFIMVYGPSIQNIISQFPGSSRLICGKIGVCVRPSGSVDLIGGRKCTWGPSYWCQSKDNAVACGPGTVQHCQERVWKGQMP